MEDLKSKPNRTLGPSVQLIIQRKLNFQKNEHLIRLWHRPYALVNVQIQIVSGAKPKRFLSLLFAQFQSIHFWPSGFLINYEVHNFFMNFVNCLSNQTFGLIKNQSHQTLIIKEGFYGIVLKVKQRDFKAILNLLPFGFIPSKFIVPPFF